MVNLDPNLSMNQMRILMKSSRNMKKTQSQLVIQKRRSCARAQAESCTLVGIKISTIQVFYFSLGSREPRQKRAFQTSYSLTSAYSLSNFDSFFKPRSIMSDFAHAPPRGHSNTGTMPLIQESLTLREQRIRREQRARLVNLGEKVYWVTDGKGVQQ